MRQGRGGNAVRRLGKASALLLLLAAYPPGRVLCQSAQAPALYRTGKWVAGALAVGFTTLGIMDHNAANRAYNGLVTYCSGGTCSVGPDGHYTDPAAEARYAVVVRNDRDARVWLITGQAALAGAIGLFVLQLHHGSGEPPNIPYSGFTLAPASVGGQPAVRVGWRLAVP